MSPCFRCRTVVLSGGDHDVVVQDDRYALAALRDLGRNPVRAGLVEDPTTYPWSSCAAYALDTPNPLLTFHPSYRGLHRLEHPPGAVGENWFPCRRKSRHLERKRCPVPSASRGCTEDEGRPFGVALQGEAPNRHERLGSKAPVVSVMEKAGALVRWGLER